MSPYDTDAPVLASRVRVSVTVSVCDVSN